MDTPGIDKLTHEFKLAVVSHKLSVDVNVQIIQAVLAEISSLRNELCELQGTALKETQQPSPQQLELDLDGGGFRKQ